jgi:hypothetical protein
MGPSAILEQSREGFADAVFVCTTTVLDKFRDAALIVFDKERAHLRFILTGVAKPIPSLYLAELAGKLLSSPRNRTRKSKCLRLPAPERVGEGEQASSGIRLFLNQSSALRLPAAFGMSWRIASIDNSIAQRTSPGGRQLCTSAGSAIATHRSIFHAWLAMGFGRHVRIRDEIRRQFGAR